MLFSKSPDGNRVSIIHIGNINLLIGSKFIK